MIKDTRITVSADNGIFKVTVPKRATTMVGGYYPLLSFDNNIVIDDEYELVVELRADHTSNGDYPYIDYSGVRVEFIPEPTTYTTLKATVNSGAGNIIIGTKYSSSTSVAYTFEVKNLYLRRISDI